MTSIVDIMKAQAMQQTAQPQLTEKAQIGLVYNVPISATIMRYGSLKKAQKAYDTIVKAWSAVLKYDGKGTAPSLLHTIECDYFVAVIDLSTLSTVNIVDIDKRLKFIPYS